jgi:hypothetical protein
MLVKGRACLVLNIIVTQGVEVFLKGAAANLW